MSDDAGLWHFGNHFEFLQQFKNLKKIMLKDIDSLVL